MNRVPCTAGNSFPLPTKQPALQRPGVSYLQDLLIRAMDTLLACQDRARERHQLGELDDRLLRDVGIDRATADREALKPFWRN
ncbi:MAG: DUF1127 domain-containing protein [Rhodospirillales bacterium]|nr:DUF1127 domain-containing protein [Rhodospirillales bacterium]